MVPSLVLCVDIDGFFIQVEQQRHPHLRNRAVALQQHADIITANSEAKAAGVTKHMPPDKARALLNSVNGVVAYVHVEQGGRVSYRPYRDASAKFFALLNTLELASIVEKGSIDEAFILCSTSGQKTATGRGTLLSGTFLDEDSLQVGMSLADTIRQRAWSSLGLRVSVGVAHNKLMAKLASAGAKPDGVHVVAIKSATAELLKAPVSRLPGLGGKVAQALAAHNIHTVQQVSSMTVQSLRTLCSTLTEQTAQKLLEYSNGIDHSVPQTRLPPKAVSLQMSLTSVPTAIPPGTRRAEPAGSGKKDGMLFPLHMHASDAPARMHSIVKVMIGDLLGRVWHDGEVHGRWPTALTLKVGTHGPAAQFLSRSDHFPSYADLSTWAHLGGGSLPPPAPPASDVIEGTNVTTGPAVYLQPVAQPVGGGSDAEPHAEEGSILGAAVKTAMAMFQDIRRAHAPDLPVVDVRVGAAKFKSIDSAKMKPLTSLFVNGPIQGGGKPRVGVDGSESVKGTKRKGACHDGHHSREAPVSAGDWDSDEQHYCRNKDPLQGADEDVDIDASMANEMHPPKAPCCVGFGSPIAGPLIRTNSTGTTPRQNPRHSENINQEVVVSGSGRPMGFSGGSCKNPQDAGQVYGANKADADAVETADARQQSHILSMASSLHVTAIDRPHSDDACVMVFDPSAQTVSPSAELQALPPSQNHVEVAPARASDMIGVKHVNFVHLLEAWQRSELGDMDLKDIADAFMKRS